MSNEFRVFIPRHHHSHDSSDSDSDDDDETLSSPQPLIGVNGSYFAPRPTGTKPHLPHLVDGTEVTAVPIEGDHFALVKERAPIAAALTEWLQELRLEP